MPKLIRSDGGAFEEVEDTFAAIEDDAADPGGDILVSLARLKDAGESLAARSQGRLGVRLEPEDEIEDLEGRLSGVALVALVFPKFRDGRPFTAARLLRTRLGFKGEIRAVGDVLRDQAGFMVRCGFDGFVPADGATASAWAEAAGRHSHVYQRAADARAPAFVERQGE